MGLKKVFLQKQIKIRYISIVVYLEQLLGAACTLKLVETLLNSQKRLKMAQKSVSTRFWVRTAPESWSKYTITGQYNTEDYGTFTDVLYLF